MSRTYSTDTTRIKGRLTDGSSTLTTGLFPADDFLWIEELWLFGLKQAHACKFGGFLLAIMLATRFWYPFESLHRYDFIFLSAILFQVGLLLFRLESPREAFVIIVFHIVATIMELFKTSDAIASWTYPEEYFFGIGNVPLFTGFMYSAVGSYIARIWRIFDFEFSDYPSRTITVLLVSGIYQLLFPPLPARREVGITSGHNVSVLENHDLFQSENKSAEHAFAIGMVSGCLVHMDCRKYRDLCKNMDFPQSAHGVGNGFIRKIVLLVLIDDVEFCIDYLGQ